MKRLYKKWVFLASLLAFSFIVLGETQAAEIEEHRRTVLSARVERVVDARARALLTCRPTGLEVAEKTTIRRLRAEYKSYAASGTPGLLSLLDAYALSSKIKRSKSECGKKVSLADLALFENDRVKFEKVRAVGRVFSFSPYTIAPSEFIFMELDPWCASEVEANFDGTRDTNPCFAGETPILNSLRDVLNKKGASYFSSSMEVDQFLARMSKAASGGKPAIALDTLFSKNVSHHQIMGIFAYLYSAGTSELGWVDGFGESFWRSTLDQGSSARASLGQYLSWLNRKDQFVILRKKLLARHVKLYLFGHPIESWNHHEFISAFLACNYAARGETLLARTVPEVLGVAYEGQDFVSHLRGEHSLSESTKNFMTDVGRHEEGGRFGRRACSLSP